MLATIAYCNHSMTLLPLHSYKCSVEVKQGRLIASTPLSFVMSLPMTVLNCLCCSLLLLHSGLATSAANPTIAETWLTNFVATLVLMLFLSPFAFVHILLDYHF